MKKLFTLPLVLALCSTMYADQVKFITLGLGTPGYDEPSSNGLGISPDGKFVCGVLEMGAGIFIANTQTGEAQWTIIEDDEGGELRHVDIFGLSTGITDMGITYSFSSGEIKNFYPPKGFRKTLCEDLTNNGELIVGSVSEQSFITHAAYTVDKGASWYLLPEPTKEDMGIMAPKAEGSAAKYVSCDGKVIYGIMGSFSVPCLWIQNEDGAYEPDFFVRRFYKETEEDRYDENKPLLGITAMRGMALSNNGRYAGLSALYQNPTTGKMYSIPAVYDIQEKTLNPHCEPQAIDPEGYGLFITAISDDGTIVGSIGQPDQGSMGSYILRAGETQAEKFVDAFPAYGELLGEGDYYGFHLPTGISADGRYISGYCFYSADYNDDSPAYYTTYLIDTVTGAGVDEIASEAEEATPVAIYTLDGQRVSELSKGVNIIRMSDGTSRKVINK